VLYSLAAQLYMLQITLGIAAIFHHLMKPYGLQWLGDVLGVGSVISMLVMPVFYFMKKETSALSHQGADKRAKLRPWLILAGTAAALLLLAWMPWQIKLERPVVLKPAMVETVRARQSGTLSQFHIHSGEAVKAEQVIATLNNPKLEAALRAVKFEVERAQMVLNASHGLADAASVKQAETLLQEAKRTQQELQRQVGELTLRAEKAGHIITPDLERIRAISLRLGQPVCEVAPLDPIQIFVPLNERQARHLRAGQRVELRALAVPDVTFEGQTEDTKSVPMQALPPNLVATLGKAN
jgi:putative peptide zinc metalloprotease protein